MRVHKDANQISTEDFEKLVFLREISEPAVWTDRMLTTLVKGVKRGKWYSLMDKVLSLANIEVSTDRVLKNGGAPGVDKITVERYASNREQYTEKLVIELRDNVYVPKPVKRIYIPKAGSKEKRPLGIPVVKDRIVQKALLNVIEPIFEKDFSESSYGFRPKRSCKDALREVNNLLKDGFIYVLDADIKGYFDSISHSKMMKLVGEKITDSRVLDLTKQFLKQNIMDEMKDWTPESGTPQGGIISPLLANIYLDGLDKLMGDREFKMVRYADDYVVLCKSMSKAEDALSTITQWMSEMELTLNSEKTITVNMDTTGASFDFLGYRFLNSKSRVKRVPSPKSIKKFRDNIRPYVKKCNGHSLSCIIVRIKPIMRGWFEYYKHSWKYVFRNLDGWVRMRLRTILRKRQKKKGRGKGSSNVKWPNKFFEDNGFFSLENAYLSYRQSLWSNC
jgi:RNA-directed DNA polymerase